MSVSRHIPVHNEATDRRLHFRHHPRDLTADFFTDPAMWRDSVISRDPAWALRDLHDPFLRDLSPYGREIASKYGDVPL